MGANKRSHGVPAPAEPKAEGELPRVLSFALRADERAAVLRVLRGYGADRSSALKAALGIDARGGDSRGV